jgi:SAM-dependent methyltransferase
MHRFRFRDTTAIVFVLWLALCGGTSAIPFAVDRDTWQRPDEIMDAMEARLGSTVADVGAGEGWFTHKLALRVGATGTVFAVDVQPAMVEDIRYWSVEEHLRQVIPVLGVENDPHLPDGQVDAILVGELIPRNASLHRDAPQFSPSTQVRRQVGHH